MQETAHVNTKLNICSGPYYCYSDYKSKTWISIKLYLFTVVSCVKSNNMSLCIKFNLAATVSGSWFCACWLTIINYWDTLIERINCYYGIVLYDKSKTGTIKMKLNYINYCVLKHFRARLLSKPCLILVFLSHLINKVLCSVGFNTKYVWEGGGKWSAQQSH